MAIFEGESDSGRWEFDLDEYWTGAGTKDDYHLGAPDSDEMLEARAMVGHITFYDENGSVLDEKHITLYSDDGWLDSELEAEVEDAADYYEPK